MNLIFSTILLALSFLRPSIQQCLSENDRSFNVTGLYKGQQEFSLNLFENVNLFNPHENIFISPYSTYHALLLAYFLSSGQTEQYLKRTLRLDKSQGKFDVFDEFKFDKNQVQSSRNSFYEFTNANKIYVSDRINIKECITQYFEDELARAPFASNPDIARVGINQWVEQHTHNMVKDLLPPGSIDASTTLALVNAAYFKGKWASKFDRKNTKTEIFYISPSKQTIVSMMHVEGVFDHDVSETLGAHILELPYEGNRMSMYVLLPPFSEEDAIDKVLKKLTVKELQDFIENGPFGEKIVQVGLPKFSVEETIQLRPILENMRVGDLFKRTSNFTRLSNDKVTLGDGIHKAKIEVNEEGTKAAAATVLFDFKSYRPAGPTQFICNHPFIYFIVDKVQKVVLFMGIFRKPH